ncbi:ABC transporter ATP-binding protein [Nocardioides sp. Soil805]|uniref:ABC transporter ATP-binding protein n=1 Tax=Nocardioides sp. Soil805 TaxID=1736416 RepID=UPI0007030CEB|nr:ABC transporter ATP-binding protein [Nocardioides sp. Soil805]KRF36816.1 ABC transporter [Nocardioides sp. Soil805]
MSLLQTSRRSSAGYADVPAAALPLHFRGVGRAFTDRDQQRQVLQDVDLTVEAGSVVALLGPSGCGKSTLLRAAAGLDTPTSGTVVIGDRPVRGIDDRCAIAFQEPRLLPWRTVRANVALGLPDGTARSEGARLVDELLGLVGLAEHADHRPREISGGMAQRTSLARALARRPGVLLLDEPFGALDALTRMKMQDLLLAVHEASPTTVLLVTHDVDEALQLADRVVVLGRPAGGTAATVSHVVDVPGERPRDRGSVDLARLRGELLESLGVDAHRH